MNSSAKGKGTSRVVWPSCDLASRAVLPLRLVVDHRPGPFIISKPVTARPIPEDVVDRTEPRMKQQPRKRKPNDEVIGQAKNGN
jgi:hypothetical protein